MARARRRLKTTKENSLKVKMKPPMTKKGSIKLKLQKVAKKVTPDTESQEPPQTGRCRGKTGYQAYSQEDLLAAVKAVKEEGMSIYKAAELYGVPKSTVHDKAAGKSNILFQRKGPAPLLSYEDEKKLVDYLLQMSNLGYMFSISELRNLASELAVEKGKLCEGTLLSPRWHRSFRTRWPVLNEKVFGEFRTCERTKKKDNLPKRKTLETFEFEEEGEQVQISTLADETDICLSNYYTELRMLMEKYDLMEKPHRIYCIDEVAIQYESGYPKARQIKALKSNFPSRSETTVVSLIGCGNALGNSLPPFLIYPGNKLDSDLLKGKYPGVQATVTENGLTDYSTMKYYIEKHFMEYALLGLNKRTPPVLVLYDGTKSKVNPDTIAWAKNHNIVLFVLPPNTNNLTFQLEKGCFRQFKDHFIRETRVFREMYSVEMITRKAICKIVSEAYPQAMSTRNLVEMFDDAGIFPYKPSIVLCDELRSERFERKNKLNSIKRRPPGMRDKGVQINLRDDTNIKLMKYGRRRIVLQEDPTVTDTDSTLTFLRDKKIQKMLEGNSNLRPRHEESDYSDSLEEYEEEEDDNNLDMHEQVDIKPPSSQYYYVEKQGRPVIHTGSRTVSHMVQNNGDQTETSESYRMNPGFKIEENHAYALNPAVADNNTNYLSNYQHPSKNEMDELDPIEQTRVAVQALQDIANDIQYVTTTNMRNTTIQNVTLNSGRMIQVVVQGDPEQVIVTEQEPVIEEVAQIEIDNSVESIIPIGTEETEIVCQGDMIHNTG